MLEFLFNKVADLKDCSVITTEVFSCEYCEILKNTYFEEDLPTAAPIVKYVRCVVMKSIALSRSQNAI